MSIEKIKEYAKNLRLLYILNNIDDELTKKNNLSSKTEDFLCELLKKETLLRSERSKSARIKNAGFPYKKYLDEIDLDRLPEDARKRFADFSTLDFIAKGQNIVEYGNPGAGKTHLAIGLGIEAANAGYSVKFYSVPTLVNKLKELKMQKNFLIIQKHFENIDLMILDELGYISFDREGGELLFSHLSLRTERKSTIVTTNLSFDKWKSIFIDPVLTTAIVDRISHNSFVVNMVGESYRQQRP